MLVKWRLPRQGSAADWIGYVQPKNGLFLGQNELQQELILILERTNTVWSEYEKKSV